MVHFWGVSPTPTPARLNTPGSLYVILCHPVSDMSKLSH